MRYEYVRVKLDKNKYALNADMESHREVIDRKAPGSLPRRGASAMRAGSP